MTHRSHPTFTFEPLTATSYRVRDAHTGEAYGVIEHVPFEGYDAYLDGHSVIQSVSKDQAATAIYRARYARGFETGAL